MPTTVVPPKKGSKILGQDPIILRAMFANLLSWLVSITFPSLLPNLLPHSNSEEDGDGNGDGNDERNGDDATVRCRCISIGRPGGMEQLRRVRLKRGIVTCGYNIRHFCLPPYTPDTVLRPQGDNDNGASGSSFIPDDCVLLKNEYFSVNYADCTIRWGLYESANRFVGWPIVPGFDLAGTIESVPRRSSGGTEGTAGAGADPFSRGDRVFGCTLFGAYSDHVLVPARQLRRIPDGVSTAQAASLPAVSLTALYALDLAGHYSRTPPGTTAGTDSGTGTGARSRLSNRAILIHSAAGGVGSMLVQMSKILNLHPIVGVVGASSKVDEARALGCDVVVDRSRYRGDDGGMWAEVERASPGGYGAVMDANGVSTFRRSYEHLCPTGRLVVFGFHSNLPVGRDVLSPVEWVKMAWKGGKMPAFDPMDMVTENKSVMAFNLSFFADEKEVVGELFEQVCVWLGKGLIRCPRVTTMEFEQIAEAHGLLQSGLSVGKIVIKT